jgi:regulator of protease activity HflC (stomatin/prohibitin superfamily)
MSYLFVKFDFMTLIILGFLILIAGFALRRQMTPFSTYAVYLRILGILLALIGFISSCIVQIGTGEVGVQILFGSVQNSTLASGLHIINPLIDVQHLDIKTQNYTMSAIHNEGAKEGDDAIRVLTSDGLEVVMDMTVLYKVVASAAPDILRSTGIDYTDKIVRPLTRTMIRDNAVYYDAVSLYSTKRDEFQNRIFNSIEADFKKRGLLLEQLLIRNITLPQPVRTSIEQKISAEQDAQKMQFVLQKERQEAERKRVEAQGIADYQRIISESLTDRQLQYESIKAQLEVAKSTNAKVIIMGKAGAPLILDTK